MAVEEEIQRLVVRLTGDGRAYSAMLSRASAQTQTTAAAVQAAGARIEGFAGRIEGFARTAMLALGGLGIAASLGAAFTQFAELERSQIRLKAAIEAGGHAVEETMARYTAFAKAVTDATLATRGGVMALLDQAEYLGVSGEQAERAAKNALALAKGNAELAMTFIRGTVELEKGNVAALRYLLRLRGVKSEAEILQRVQQRINTGWKVAQAEANSTAGQVEKLKRAFGGLSRDVGGMVATALNPLITWLGHVVQVINAALVPAVKAAREQVRQWTAAAVDFISRNRLVVGGVAAAVASFLLATRAVRLTVFAVTSLNAVLTALGIKQVASTALWLVWKGAVLAAQAVVFLFNAQVALWNTLLAGGGVLAGLWTAASAIATAATWAWNAALAVMDALLGPEVLLAAVATAAVLAAAFLAAAGAVWGVYQAGASLVRVFSQLPTSSGPIATVTGMLREWGPILQDIVTALSVDLPLAWELTKAGVRLALSEIKDQWPPLWAFIQETTRIGARLAAGEFERSFMSAIANILAAYIRYLDFTGLVGDRVKAKMDELNAKVEEARQLAGQLAGQQIKAALDAYKAAPESEETKKAREELDKLRATLHQLMQDRKDEEKPLPSPSVEQQFREATKAVEKFDAALAASAEARTRAAEYAQRLEDIRKGANTAPTAPVVAAPYRSAEAGSLEGQQLTVMKDIRDTLKDQAKKPGVTVQPAGLG